MNLAQMIAAVRERMTQLLAERQTQTDRITSLRAAVEAGTAVDEAEVRAAVEARAATDAAIDAAEARMRELEAELARESAVERLQSEVRSAASLPAYDRVIRTGDTSEARTYAPHRERGFDASTGQFRRGVQPGGAFVRDVTSAFLGDYDARARLERHMAEERVERGEYLQRAVGTGAFAGLTVPQYLTDLYAPAVAARRPFADAVNGHDLPPDGMTVNLSQITTATAVADQSAENAAVTETDMDDTLLTINVRTAAGQQTLSRQAIERSTGVEAIVLDDLFRRYATNLDSNLLNLATIGLTNVATSVAYTDASPTAAELYPKILEGLAGVEAAMLDQASGDNLAVMHSRRWYWMQSQVGTSWPFMGQPGIPAQQGAVNLGATYGSGVRGVLPNGTPVIVDNNIATNKGAGTNEDEIYLVDRQECHLWEDRNAPLFIRAEQPKAANLGVLLVVYGYYAFTHTRYAHSRKIGGTGLVTPTF